jgi:hypothetical protein
MPIPNGEQFKLFHATPKELSSDAQIEPRLGSAMMPDQNVAWATDSLERAKFLAGLAAHREGLPASPVYGVTHIDPSEHEKFLEEQEHRRTSDWGGAPDYVSYKGFNPVKIVAWGDSLHP